MLANTNMETHRHFKSFYSIGVIKLETNKFKHDKEKI